MRKTMAFNQGKLLDQGIFFSSVSLPLDRNSGNYLFGNSLRKKHAHSLAVELNELSRSGYHTIIISADSLADFSPANVEWFRQETNAHETNIVIYCANWVPQFILAWKESLRCGRTETLPEFVARRLSGGRGSKEIDFIRPMDRFSGAFGQQSISLVCYDHLMENNFNLVGHFLAWFCHWTGDHALPSEVTLESLNDPLSAVEAELVRILNVLDPSLGQRYAQSPYIFADLELERTMQSYRRSLRFDETNSLLRSIHDQVYSRYQEQVVYPHPPGYLFAINQHIDYLSTDYLLDAAVNVRLKELKRIIKNLC
jgi:hypothetical protein